MNKLSFKSIYYLFFILLLISVGCNVVGNICDSGGYSNGNPDVMWEKLSPGAKKLIKEAYNVGKGKVVVDHHVHIIGSGSKITSLCSKMNKNETYTNPKRFRIYNPKLYIKTKVLMKASHITELDEGNQQFIEYLLSLVRNTPSNTQFYLLAMSKYWEKKATGDGFVANIDKTDMYIPNDYVFNLAECLNNKLEAKRFVPVISVHPHNPDAIKILEEFNKKGVSFVKWLPNAMNIDPRITDDKYMVFYKKMHELKMVLMSHTGREEAINVENETHQNFGFPAFLKHALDAGVTVVMCHSGGDVGHGDKEIKYEGKNSSESFFDMMDKASKKTNWDLYGDISALTIEKNIERFVYIIGNETLKYRILYGSDYPLPAVSFLYPVGELIDRKYLEERLRKPLREIFKYNPLIFDFVLKRNIKNPANGKKLPDEVFWSLEENAKRRLKELNGK